MPDTRQQLIDAAFAEIHRHGFGPTGLDAVLARTDVTKGALYHHFDSKEALGYAVFDEIVVPWVRQRWIEPVAAAADPLAELTRLVKRLPKRTAEERALGCPLNNLVQELGATDAGFRARTGALLDEWRAQLARDLERGKRDGVVGADVRPKDSAAFLVSALEGVVGVAKPQVEPTALKQAVRGFVAYLESLR